MSKAYVYKIECLVSGTMYIGKTVNPDRRWIDHKNTAWLTRTREYKKPLYVGMRKYGIDSFKFSILESTATEEQAYALECYWIDSLKSAGITLYNEKVSYKKLAAKFGVSTMAAHKAVRKFRLGNIDA